MNHIPSLSTEPIVVTSDHHAAWWDCPRRRYLEFHRQGHKTGPPRDELTQEVPYILAAAFRLFLKAHKGLEQSIPEAADHARDYIQACYIKSIDMDDVDALFGGWYHARWESLLETYTIAEVAKGCTAKLAPLVVYRCQPDALLIHRETQELSLLHFAYVPNATFKTPEALQYDTHLYLSADCVSRCYDQPCGIHIEVIEEIIDPYFRFYDLPARPDLTDIVREQVIDIETEVAEKLAIVQLEGEQAATRLFPGRFSRHCLTNHNGRQCPHLDTCWQGEPCKENTGS